MKRLEHPNIVRLLDAQHQGSRIHIVMEFCSGGTLSKYCKQFPDNKPPLETTRTFLKAIVGALEYLHKEHVIHRDLKPQNILLQMRSKDMVLKVADFGCAKILTSADAAAGTTAIGTFAYAAPEVSVPNKALGLVTYSYPVDIWSVGCILLELLSGKRPYFELEGHHVMQICFKHSQGEGPRIDIIENDPSVPTEALDLVKSCLKIDPAERPTASDLLNHPFLAAPLSKPSARQGNISPRRAAVSPRHRSSSNMASFSSSSSSSSSSTSNPLTDAPSSTEEFHTPASSLSAQNPT